MAFLIDEAYLPATLTVQPMTDQQFADFCGEHPDLFFEMTAEGELLIMPPNFSLAGFRNSAMVSQLDRWAIADGRGFAGESSGGFVLPNGARRSPDASWVSKVQMNQLRPEEFETYWHLCPAFVIELRSKTDRLRILREKMHEYIANGGELGWLIDPESRSVEIFRPGRDSELASGIATISGEGPVAGLTLDLRPVWDPFAWQPEVEPIFVWAAKRGLTPPDLCIRALPKRRRLRRLLLFCGSFTLVRYRVWNMRQNEGKNSGHNRDGIHRLCRAAERRTGLHPRSQGVRCRSSIAPASPELLEKSILPCQ